MFPSRAAVAAVAAAVCDAMGVAHLWLHNPPVFAIMAFLAGLGFLLVAIRRR